MKRVLLALALLLAATVAAEELSPPARGTPAAVPAVPASARLAAWRAGARPPRQVPATAIVRAAARSEKEAGAEGVAPVSARPSVEIIWDAPGKF